MMSGYLDDSYDKEAVVIGGWIARDHIWEKILRDWDNRIKLESDANVRKGLREVKRYHATDCANFQNDFKGWSRDRQVRLTKRLIEIMTDHRRAELPMIFSWGMSLAEAKRIWPDASSNVLRDFCYRVCAFQCFKEIGLVMREVYSHDKIVFFHDDGNMYRFVQEGLRACKGHPGNEQLVSVAPIAWQDCHLLQPADLVAYESFKVIRERLHRNENHVRIVLEKLVSRKSPIVAGYIPVEGFREIYAMFIKHKQETLNEDAQ